VNRERIFLRIKILFSVPASGKAREACPIIRLFLAFPESFLLLIWFLTTDYFLGLGA
jgi:hypothetical protein